MMDVVKLALENGDWKKPTKAPQRKEKATPKKSRKSAVKVKKKK
jgi:hypothetical protein